MKIPSLFDKCVLWWPGQHHAYSSTAKTISNTSYSGNATQVTTIADPYGGSTPIGYFNSSSGLSVPASSDMVFTGDFTIEFYVNCGNQTRLYPQVIANNSTNDWAANGFTICIDRTDASPDKVTVYKYEFNTSVSMLVSTTSVNNSQWHHIAIARSGTTIRLFIDGTIEDTETYSGTISFNVATWEICHHIRSVDASFGTGYLSEMRFSNCCRYTSGFTPQTSRFVSDEYTRLLLHMTGSGTTFVDSSGITDFDEFPIIPSGVTVTNSGTWEKEDLGNSRSLLKFVSTNQNYITLSDNDAWFFGTGDFSISFWLKFNTALPGSTVSFISQNGGAAVVSPIEFVFYHSGNNKLYVQAGSSTASWDIIGAWAASGSKTNWAINTWYYITVVRSGTSVKVYVDGVQDISVTIAANANFFNSTSTFDIMRYQNTTNNWLNGNIKDYMIFNGRGLTQAEIIQLMRLTHPITGPGIIPGPYDYWRLS